MSAQETPRHNKPEPVVDNRHLSPYPSRTMDPPFSLVERAREIEAAGDLVNIQVHGKLDVIARQIRSLKEEARQVIDQAREDMELHRIKCNFEKRIGQIIYLYLKANGEKYFSLLSPEDWRGNPPNELVGAYRLNVDRSFERLDMREHNADDANDHSDSDQ